ncbi:hypothetical protein JAAARDRAFT_206148 [Jaapia argillacea MUCL 33604]|uniref:Uncharacterized protein n=1 Tax=Jaapia argillacea MUCL 33604 TaxID=933084 RepID=A0A067Q9D0_9AGAM|nr:hypothetical protein JAAARDRAFT_206148 [Jaapia argillacea MUCL 33604]
MRNLILIFCLYVLYACHVAALTTTVVNPVGQTVVEIITTGAAGLTTTSTISTLTTSAPTTTAVVTTPLPGQQGPVGQPGASPPNGAIPYYYTTTNAAGNTIVVEATFTPSFPATQAPPPLSTTGTILQYSDWLTVIGSNTAAANPTQNSSASSRFHPSSQGPLAFLAVVLASGVWLVLS